MGQIIINTGNVANDGLGTPLRNAFNQVNYNFTQLFNAGPSGSNISIANNSITVTNTNGNLNLATNGIGSIVPKANFVPDIANVRSIGTGTNRFNTVYAQYVNANTGTFAGNVYVAGNLQVTGNVITVDYSNLSVANSNITLGTGAANSTQADGGGLLIPIAEANFTYNYSANSWNSTIAITAPTFIGDGSNLTNVIANVQANALLGNTFSNSINYSNLTSFGQISALSITGNVSTTGNVYANAIVGNRVTANYLYGNGSNITNITANAIVGNVPFALVANTAYVANLAALATQAINADTALFAINANLASWANTATIAQTANAATYAVQADNANSAVVAGMAYELAPTADLSITGNITTGGYFIGDGSLISNIVVTISYGNSNVASYLQNLTTNVSTTGNITADGNITGGNILTGEQVIANGEIQSGTGLFTGGYLSVNGSSDLANVNVSGNLSAVGNINAATFSASGNILSNSLIATGVVYAGIDGQLTTSNSMTFADVGGEMTLTVDYFSTSTVFTNDILGDGNNINVSAQYGNSVLFDTTGGVSATGNITGNYFIGDGSQLTNLPGGNATLPLANGTSNFDIATANGNATITANTGNTWTFGADGNLALAGNINYQVPGLGASGAFGINSWYPVKISTGDGGDYEVETWTFADGGNLILPGGGMVSDTGADGIGLTAANPPVTIVITGADFTSVNLTYTVNPTDNTSWIPAGYNPATDPYIQYSGNEWGIHVPGFGQALYVNTGPLWNPATQWNTNPPLGTVAPTGVYTYSNPTWIFDLTGNLVLPGNTSSINYANGAPYGGTGGSYGNANVANFLGDFGSNAISTSGNITASGLLIDTVTGITSNAGNININQITGLGGYLNAYGANLSGNINAVNLSLLGNIISDANISGNVNAANISAGNISLSGNIFAYGANIYSVNGLTMEGGNLTMSSITGMGGSISAEGNIISANLSATGNVSGQNINGGNLSLSGNVLSNLNIQQGNISVSGNITSGSELTVVSANITGVQGLTVSGGDITIPSSMSGGSLSAYGNITGNYILGNGSQLTNLPAPTVTYDNTSNGYMDIMTYDGNIKYVSTATIEPSSGNIHSAGNISVTGDISSSGNVYARNLTGRLGNGNSGINIANNGNVNVGIGPFSTTILNIAGTGISVFGNISTNGYVSATGNVTANTFVGNGSGLTNVAQQTTGSWTVTAGTNNYSFTVNSGTYNMWVTSNIPNGIIVWNATATVTNINVPVVGQQYAWVYDGGGTPLDFVSIPNQFIGTANSIVRSNVAPSGNTNTFTFSINNTSGGNVIVNYGYTKL
jgi:hypothetical protein